MSDLLNGAWEERGVIGTRLEICGKTLTVLWRNAPVLTTKFSTKETPGGVRLVLRQTGLRYEHDVKDYAALTGLFLRDGRLYMEETFPISGTSTAILDKTSRSRYGDVTDVSAEILPRLEGIWTDDRAIWTLTFAGHAMTFAGRKYRVCAVRGNEAPHEIRIIDLDPSRYDFGGISFLAFTGDTLTAQEILFDAPPHTLIFKKQNPVD